jgi:DNA modification methylase
VLDLFLGSGSTAVAAERTGRTCYGTDYNEGYVAVVLERLSEEGLKPERVESFQGA